MIQIIKDWVNGKTEKAFCDRCKNPIDKDEITNLVELGRVRAEFHSPISQKEVVFDFCTKCMDLVMDIILKEIQKDTIESTESQ